MVKAINKLHRTLILSSARNRQKTTTKLSWEFVACPSFAIKLYNVSGRANRGEVKFLGGGQRIPLPIFPIDKRMKVTRDGGVPCLFPQNLAMPWQENCIGKDKKTFLYLSELSKSKSCPMKFKLGEMFGLHSLTKSYAASSERWWECMR